MKYSPIVDKYSTYTVPQAEDIQIHTLYIDEIPEAANIHITEAYAGTTVGGGSCWYHEYHTVILLAIARSLEFDYQLGLESLD